MTVHIIVQHEASRKFSALAVLIAVLCKVDSLSNPVTGKAGAGVPGFIPGAVLPLAVAEKIHASANSVVKIRAGSGNQGHDRPAGLGRS